MDTAVNLLAGLLVAAILVLAVFRIREQNKIRDATRDVGVSHERFLNLMDQLESLTHRKGSRDSRVNSVSDNRTFAGVINLGNERFVDLPHWHWSRKPEENVRSAFICYIHSNHFGHVELYDSHLEYIWLQEDEAADELTVAV
jgi:hypothetical protein